MPSDRFEYHLDIVASDDARGVQAAELLRWLEAEGFQVASTKDAAETLGPQEMITLFAASSAAISAFVTALAAYVRARRARVVVRSPNGNEIVIEGLVDDAALNDLVRHIDPSQSE